MTSSVDVDALDLSGPTGAVWAPPADGDLNANVVVIAPGESIASHVNREVDVLFVVLAGGGVAHVDGETYRLAPRTLVLVPKGSVRDLQADAETSLVFHETRGRAVLG